MRKLCAVLIGLIMLAAPMSAQQAPESETPVQDLLQLHAEQIAKSSRRTIQPVIDALVASELPQIETVLATWQARDIWQRKSDGFFFAATEVEKRLYDLTDFDTGESIGEYASSDLKQVKPNSGVQGLIATALVRFQLNSPDPDQRVMALDSLARAPNASLLEPLRASIAPETDAEIKERKQRLATLLTIAHDTDEAARIAAISEVAGDLSVDVRATLNPLLSSGHTFVAADAPMPEGKNIARTLEPAVICRLPMPMTCSFRPVKPLPS